MPARTRRRPRGGGQPGRPGPALAREASDSQTGAAVTRTDHPPEIIQVRVQVLSTVNLQVTGTVAANHHDHDVRVTSHTGSH